MQIATKQPKQIVTQSELTHGITLEKRLSLFKVTGPKHVEKLKEVRGQIKERIKIITDKFRPHKTTAKQLYDGIKGWEAEVLNPYKRCDQIANQKLVNFKQAQDQKAEEARKEAEEEARSKEQAQKSRYKTLATNAKDNGDVKKAKQFRTKAKEVSFTPQAKTPKTADIGKTRKIWSSEITDFHLLVKAVAAGHAPIESLLPNQTFLNQYARETEYTNEQKTDKLSPIAGVKFIYTEGVVSA